MSTHALLTFCLLIALAIGCATSGRGSAPAVPVGPVVPFETATQGPTPTPNIVTIRPPSTPTTATRPAATRTPTTIPPPTTTPVCGPYFDPIAFFPDGSRLLGIVNSGETWATQVFNLETRKVEDEIPAPYLVQKAALSPDGKILAWALEDNSIRLTRLSDHHEIAFMEGHFSMVTGLVFSPSGDRLYSGSHDGWVRIWEPDSKLQSAFQPSEVLGLGISPDGNQVVTIHFDGPARLWDLKEGKQVGEYSGSISGAYDGAFARYTPDGRYLAISLGGGGANTVFRVSDGAKLWEGGTFAIDFSPDGRLFAVAELKADGSGEIVLRTIEDQQAVQTIPGHAGMIWRLVFSPDGRLLASADGAQARIWQVSDGQLVYEFPPRCVQ